MEYDLATVKRLDAKKPVDFKKSVDVLNFVFGERYIGAIYKGWQKGSRVITVDQVNYMIWFPKLAVDGKPGAAFGWINTLENNGYTIIEKPSDAIPKISYKMDDSIRLVFAKENRSAYQFRGVFVLDKKKTTPDCHVYKKVADVADFSGEHPRIAYFPSEDIGESELLETLKTDMLKEAPSYFAYTGQPKIKAQPVMVGMQKVYPRDRKTAVNALAHAGFRCEVDSAHPTFLRKHSDRPYTEPHHLIPMSCSDQFDVSLDVEENIVSLCSNCHNQIHYGQGAKELLEKLYLNRRDVLKKVGIEITFEQLLSFYE